MPYCNHCGTKNSAEDTFCRKCGKRIKHEKGLEKAVKKNRKYWIIGGIVGIFIIILLVLVILLTNSNSKPNIPTPQGSVEKACPYDCCNGAGYTEKQCSTDYECKNNKCVAMDSDGDGLTDIEEKKLGTNPRLYDSDGDTLGDYQEVNVLHTNPLNPNTDGDRYNDNLDPEPTIKNTADITASITNKEFNIQWISLGIAIVGGGIVSPSMVIAKPSVTVNINNLGTDYSSYLNYDVIVYVSNQELKRVHQSKGKIDMGYSNTETINFEIKAEDVPSIIINAITNKNSQWDARIGNIEYEKF